MWKLHYAHSARIQWTDDDDKLPGSYPYKKYMVCVVLNSEPHTVDLSGDVNMRENKQRTREDRALSQ